MFYAFCYYCIAVVPHLGKGEVCKDVLLRRDAAPKSHYKASEGHSVQKTSL